jgi:hypothetical protein
MAGVAEGRVVFTAVGTGLFVTVVVTMVVADGEAVLEVGAFLATADNPRIRASGMRIKIAMNFQLITFFLINI